MTEISPAEELFFLGADLPSAKLLARLALEIAYRRLLEKNSLKEAVNVRFPKGTGRVAVIVNVTDLQETRKISDYLHLGSLVHFGLSDPGAPPYSVIGSVNREVCLRICLNADQKLQINVGKEAAKGK